MPKSYLSPSDRERISKELQEIRSRRRATGDVSASGANYYRPPEVDIDDGKLAAKEARLKRVLEKESPPMLNPMQKNAAYKELRGLVREFEEKALTQYDQGLGYPSIMAKQGPGAEADFGRAKQKCMAWESAPRGQFVSQRIKELASVIDPDNSQLRNLEHFRRRK